MTCPRWIFRQRRFPAKLPQDSVKVRRRFLRNWRTEFSSENLSISPLQRGARLSLVKNHRISNFNEKDVGVDHKPSSVSPPVTRKALMIIPLGQQLPVASSDATRERWAGRP